MAPVQQGPGLAADHQIAASHRDAAKPLALLILKNPANTGLRLIRTLGREQLELVREQVHADINEEFTWPVPRVQLTTPQLNSLEMASTFLDAMDTTRRNSSIAWASSLLPESVRRSGS